MLPPISAQLLNAILDPVLVIDRTQNTTVVANSQFIKLTAFTQMELSGMPVSNLVEGAETSDLFTGEEHKIKLSRRSRPSIEMVMSSTQIDPTGQWLLLSFKLSETIEQQQMHAGMIGMLAQAMTLLDQNDFNMVMQEAVGLAARICRAGQAGIYIAESDQPRLRLVAAFPHLSPEESGSGILPDELPAADLSRLDVPGMWFPGRRLQTDLYKAARFAGLSYLASVPIGSTVVSSSAGLRQGSGQANGLVGLLVVSDLERQPFDNMLDILRLLGAQLTAIYNQRIKLDGLNARLRQQAELLVLRNGQMDHQREGVLVISPDLTVIEINPAAEWMLEYTPEEVQGQPVQNILIGTKSLLPALQDACVGIPTHNLSDIALHRRSGQSFAAQVRIIPVHSLSEGTDQPEGVVIGILLFISDVSEHEQIQVRTQQLEHRALLGEVIAVFAHEVRNPINNIATGLQLMETWLVPSRSAQGEQVGIARQSQLVQRMLGDCQRLNHLMESVLQFSRPIEPKLEPLDLLTFLQRFLDRWRPRLARVNVVPYLNPDQVVPKVMADPRALEQVFTNLISNAVHAMSNTGGTMAILLVPNQTIANFPQVEITVSDTGPGIPEEFRARLFEPFATTHPSGTGLGLAITKRIVTAHRGSIWVESFPGGTVFHILLPAETSANGE